jgi:SAM-dependent methyltransferase
MSGYGPFARYYDALTANVDYARRAGYFDTLIKRYLGRACGLLLDLACGTGSLSIELAGRGYDVIGADASAEMLSVAMSKSYDAERRVLFLHQSMEELDLYGTIDAAVCALDSLNHLPDEAAFERAVGRVALFLAPGGVFLFDVNTAYKHREILADNAYLYDLDEVFCAWQNSYRAAHNRVDITLDFFEPQGKDCYRRSTERFSERIFDHETVCAALLNHGLELVTVLGDDSPDPPGADAQRVVYVGRKI